MVRSEHYKEWIGLKLFYLQQDSHSRETHYPYVNHLGIAYHNPCKDTSEHYVDDHSF